MTNWRTKIENALKKDGEDWCDVIHHTMSEDELNREFDDGFGVAEGVPFTLWTKDFVYFPAEYDGSEYVASVRRNPCDIPTEHV